MHDTPEHPPTPPAGARRRPWSAPELVELPRLVKLTLQTGGAATIPGGGSIGSGLGF